VKTKRKAPRKKLPTAVRKTWYATTGGPLERALLSTPGTLTFRLNGQRGFYDQQMVWQDV
jgi:hypothetical protein